MNKRVKQQHSETVPKLHWTYVLPVCLAATFVVEVISGTYLWLHYSPSAYTAWESVWHIENQISGGQFCRNLHHFSTDLTIFLIGAWLLQLAVLSWKTAPRKVPLWVSLACVVLLLALARTGEVLPWDQKAYSGAHVVANIVGSIPILGENLKLVIMGGAEPGHFTLTRFTVLHCFLLPLLLLTATSLLFLVKSKTTVTQSIRRQLPAITITTAGTVLCLGMYSLMNDTSLGSPADQTGTSPIARPAWYFLPLFELLRHVPVAIGAYLIPTATLILLGMLPWIGKNKLGRAFGSIFAIGVLGSACWLGLSAYAKDMQDIRYQSAKVMEKKRVERLNELICRNGIPPAGAAEMAERDPLLRGPRLFAEHCSGCHNHAYIPAGLTTAKTSAPDLTQFANREWVSAILDLELFQSAAFFGNTKFKDGKMARKVLPKISDAPHEDLQAIVAALSAEAALPYQREIDRRDEKLIQHGKNLLTAEYGCTDCHQYYDITDIDEATALDLTGYGTSEWLQAFISNPKSARFYGNKNDSMPTFHQGSLTTEEIELLSAWLRREWSGASGFSSNADATKTFSQTSMIHMP